MKELRRQFDLPEYEVEELDALGLNWETLKIGSKCWLLVHDFAVPAGYNAPTVTVAVEIPNGYPTAKLDMAYVYPVLSRLDGVPIPQVQARMAIDVLQFQRWSRHYSGKNPYIPGEYTLRMHLILVEKWFERELQKAA